MLSGTIRSLAVEKGYGFIRPADGSPDVFFHRSAVAATWASLSSGQRVAYTLDEKSPKVRAATVQLGSAHAARKGRPRRSEGRARLAKEYEYGFVTRVHRSDGDGYISSVKHGPELWFPATAVSGEKPYSELRPGDYVAFVREPHPADPQQPIAKLVMAAERERQRIQLSLPRHKRARGKKPSWRGNSTPPGERRPAELPGTDDVDGGNT